MEYTGPDKRLSLLASLYNARTLQSGAPIKRYVFRGDAYRYTKDLAFELMPDFCDATRAILSFEVLCLAEKGLIIPEWNK